MAIERKANKRFYLVQLSYTADAWRALVDGEAKGTRVERNRYRAVKELVESFDGCFGEVSFPCVSPPGPYEKFVSFGEYDIVAILAFPDEIQAAAFAMAVSASGSVRAFKTTPLLPMADGETAMATAKEKTAKVRYRGPGA